MKIRSSFLYLVVIIIVQVALLYIYHTYVASNKIAYVRSGEVINSFNGIKLAQKQFEQEYRIAKGNADTLMNRMQALKNNILLKNKSNVEWASKVKTAENNYYQYQKTAEQQLQTRQQELTRDALDKMNLFIQDYGKENNYTLILGSTDNGSILYGQPARDITNEILIGLNAKYDSITTIK